MKDNKLLKNIFIILGLIAIVSSNVFTQLLSNLDEIWIFNFGKNIVDGLLPYKDFNIILTPLFPYICALFLKIFGNEMIVLRFVEVIQTVLILFLVYKILEKLKVNKSISLLFVIILYYMYSRAFCFDYNWATLLITLVVLYIEVKYIEQNINVDFKINIFLGLLVGITILLKQTTGIVLSLVFITYKIFAVKSIKEFFNIFFVRLLGILLPILIFAMYLTYHNIWVEFIDYAILGIRTFSNVVPYTKLLQDGNLLAYEMPIFLFIIIITSIITYFKKSYREKTWVKNLHILLFYDIATLVVMYPIVDTEHFAIASVCTLMTSLYLLYIFEKRVVKNEEQKFIVLIKKFFNYGTIILFATYVLMSIYSLITYINSDRNTNYLNHFKHIEAKESLYNRVINIKEYIENKEDDGQRVLILDTMAAVINIPMDKYYKDYDMLNLGNFGEKGEDRNNRGFK